jgi:uncharacterized protein (DUF1015 family)
MVEIVPFRGILYNLEKTGSLSNVTAPPYDVIKPEMQEELYRRSPFNVVRLILGKEYPDDGEANNRYTRSARDFKNWLEQDVLVRDAKPCYYAYSQEYKTETGVLDRLGFLARLRLEDFASGNVCPHEFTLAKAKRDRARLLDACRANFSPIFGLFSNPDKSIDRKLERATRGAPLDVIEENGVTHKLWRIEDAETIDFLTRAFADKKVYIADGHHRYETALAYGKSRGNPDDSAHVLMFLTNLDSGALSIFAIHRLIRCPRGLDAEKLMARLREFFDAETLPENVDAQTIRSALSAAGRRRTAFAAYLGKGRTILLKLKDARRVVPFLEPDQPAELQTLDVVQLHALVIKPILDIDTRVPENQRYVAYTIDVETAMQDVDSANFDLAFFMNPTRIEQVRELAEKGIRLPQKATYFYPKLLSGLVMNKFQASRADASP